MLVDPKTKVDSKIEQNIKKDIHKLKPYVPAAIMIVILFLIFKYWDSGVHFISLCFHAASGLILGLIIAFLVNIIMSSYENILVKMTKGKVSHGFKRALCLVLSFLTVILIIAGVIGFVIPELVNSLSVVATGITKELPKLLVDLKDNKYIGEYATSLMNNLPTAEDLTNIFDKMGDFLLSGASGALGVVLSSASTIISIVATLGIGIFFSVYVLADKEKLGRQVTGLINEYVPGNEFILALARVLGKNFRGYIVAQVTDACILGCLCALGMTVLRLPYAIMSGVIMAFFALIPIIGAFIGMFSCAFFILTVSPMQSLIFLIFILTLQQIDNNIIYPRVVGNKVDLPGMWVLAAVTLFGGLFGIVGIMCSVPIAATCYQLLRDNYRERVRKAKAEKAAEGGATETNEAEKSETV